MPSGAQKHLKSIKPESCQTAKIIIIIIVIFFFFFFFFFY